MMSRNKVINKIVICTILIVVFSAFQSQAFRLEPMVETFTFEKNGNTKIFRVENEGSEKIAVKIQAFFREQDENGKEKRTPTDHFKIYPEQLTLEASDSRVIRVTYKGPSDLNQEQAYRLVASQLPISFKDEVKKSGIKFLFEFVASVYVGNDKFFPKLELESVSKTKGKLNIGLINKGQKHVLLRGVKLHLENSKGQKLSIDDAIVKDWSSENILAGSKRKLNLNKDFSFDVKKDKAHFEIKDDE